jgi:dephospho-CoA kinase
MVVIGVTGGLGTGKSTVAAMFKALGAVVLDADVIAHQVMEPKRLAWRTIVETFGESVLNDDQTVNRRTLASVVFRDEPRRKRLEAIIHPPVLRSIKQRLRRLRRVRRVRAVVLDVPLLVEAGAHTLVDALVVVTAPPEIQRERLKSKYGWSDEETTARIDAQMELSAKVALADHVVDNGNGVDATRTQVKRIWNQRVPRKANRRTVSIRRSSTSRR